MPGIELPAAQKRHFCPFLLPSVSATTDANTG